MKREPKQLRLIDEASNDPTVPTVQYDITSFGADYDVEGLVKRMEREDIIIPPFQRGYVWNIKEASRFIESLLLGLPVPGIFLAREQDSKKLLVIDGQQRLKTLQYFFSGIFDPRANGNKRTFNLIGVQPRFEGNTYNSLKDEDRILLNDSIIHATIVKQESPPDEDTSIYHIFERLNTSGRKLSPQQIRVAVYHGELMKLIKELNDYQPWRDIYGETSSTLKDQELILRFLALYLDAENYRRPMKEFLNIFAKRYRQANVGFLDSSENIFKRTIDLVNESLGEKAFRPERALNTAVFDSVMYGIAKRINREKLGPKQVRVAYEKLFEDVKYIDAISQATSDKTNVDYRLTKAMEQFGQIEDE